MFFSPFSSFFVVFSCVYFIAVNNISALMSTQEVETLTLDVTIFIEPFNLACCEATNPITHFTLTTRYDESITK